TTAARRATRLHTTQRPEDVAPGNGERFANQQVVEDDAPAHQQLLGKRFAERVAIIAGSRGVDHRPAALARGETADAAAQAARRQPGARQRRPMSRPRTAANPSAV